MPCISCARGMHEECFSDPCCCASEPNIPQAGFTDEEVKGRKRKDDSEITTSAGRKRAAAEYTIDPEAFCEWSLKAECGGGKKPILGCVGGKQKHRHHGPVKNTARNERTNIHLICATCHNTWHAKNDPVYSEDEYNELPASPRDMTKQEILWVLSTGKREM